MCHFNFYVLAICGRCHLNIDFVSHNFPFILASWIANSEQTLVLALVVSCASVESARRKI